jgi:hypothetical protein
MKKVEEFLVGLIVTWIVFFFIVLYVNPMYVILLPLGGLIIGVSLTILVVVRISDRREKRHKPVKPIVVPETSETAAVKSQLATKPEDASLHLALARKYMAIGSKHIHYVEARLGYFEKAEKELAEVVALEPEPENPRVLMNLASVHVVLNRLRKAEEEFLKAMEIEPDNVEYKIVYARFLTRVTEKYYEAEAVLKQALSQPHSREMDYLIHYYFHNIYSRLSTYGKKGERLTYEQNAESEYKHLFPEYEKGKYEVDFIRDENAVSFEEAVLCGKIGLGVWKKGPDQLPRLTYIKIIEIKTCLPNTQFL